MDVSRVTPNRVEGNESSGRRTQAQAVPDPVARRERTEVRSTETERKVEAKPEPEASKPVVNTSGQTTGTRINTSA